MAAQTQQGKAVILGCGVSLGVPQAGNPDGLGAWGRCDPGNPKNRRLRCSLYIEVPQAKILIDTPADARQQFLAHTIQDLDAVLYTHYHADHIMGIDELRAVCVHNNDKRSKGYVDVYGGTETLSFLEKMFTYAFVVPDSYAYIYKPNLKAHKLQGSTTSSSFGVSGLDVIPLPVVHGKVPTNGYRIGNLAYIPDVKEIPDDTMECLQGLDVLIVDACRYKPHTSHAHLDLALEWIKDLKPKRAVLTNLGTEMDYETVLKETPENVEPAYDGLEVSFSF